MAAELASGYISLTVKMAKGGMAEVTKEVKKAGQEGGSVYSDEFNKKVGDQVGKNLPDTVGKATKRSGSGGLAKAAKDAAAEFGKGMLEGIQDALGGRGGGTGLGQAAKDAAEEFGKGFRDGVKDALTGGDIEGALDNINTKVKKTTDIIKDIGGATGIDTSPVVRAADTITTAIDKISTTAGDVQTSLEAFKSGDSLKGLQGVVDTLKDLHDTPIELPEGFVSGLEKTVDKMGDLKTNFDNLNDNIDKLAQKGEGSKLDNVATKIGLIGTAIETVNDIKTTSEDWNTWAEEHISWYKWLNQYTPDQIGQMARDRANAFISNIGTDIANSPGGPPGRFGPPLPGSQPHPYV